MSHDYAHGLARCSCGRIGLDHWPWEPSTRYSRDGLPQAVNHPNSATDPAPHRH